MNEIWRNIKNYEGLYQVSNLGRVKSLNYNRTGKERVLKAGKDKDGYLYVVLSKDGVSKHFFVHRLVAEAFIPNPEGKPCIDHIIPVSLGGTNVVTNIRWATHEENQNNPITKQKMSEAKKGYKHPRSKPIIGVNKATGEEVRFACTMEAQRVLGIAQSNICSCLKGRYKSAGNYYWYYA